MNNNLSLDSSLCRYLPNLIVLSSEGKKKYYRTLEISQGNILLNSRSDETVINIKQLKEMSEIGKILNVTGYIKSLKDAYYNQEVDDYHNFGHINYM